MKKIKEKKENKNEKNRNEYVFDGNRTTSSRMWRHR